MTNHNSVCEHCYESFPREDARFCSNKCLACEAGHEPCSEECAKDFWVPMQGDYKRGGRPKGDILWEEHMECFEAYWKKGHRSQSAARIAERGGFGYSEFQLLVGHEPKTWKPV